MRRERLWCLKALTDAVFWRFEEHSFFFWCRRPTEVQMASSHHFLMGIQAMAHQHPMRRDAGKGGICYIMLHIHTYYTMGYVG